MSKKTGQTFVFGAVVLMASNILVKLIGALFRIPLTNIIKVEGMGYFNAAYSIYVMFYNISTAGIPVAVSRMVAASASKGNYKEAQKIFDIALKLFVVIGVVGTAVMMAGAQFFAEWSKMPDSSYAMLAIAPTIFFICVSSAYRGYFQGMSDMVPTAVSQVIEAVGKLGIGLAAAIYFTRNAYPVKITAAFVISGVSIGVALSMFYAMAVKIKYASSPEYRAKIQNCPYNARPSKSILSELVITAIPITLASSIMGLTNVIDTFLIANRLISAGVSAKAAASYYGTYSSMVIPLFNMTPTFIYPFAISAIPAVSSAIAAKRLDKAYSSIESAFRNCAIISIPCAIGLASMSRGIVRLLFKEEMIKNGASSVSSTELAAPALSVVACAIVFLGVIAITNSVLQAWRLERYTLVSTGAGVAVKFAATYIVTGIPGTGIIGSAVGTMLCYFTIMAINLFFVIKKTGYVPNVGRIFVKPLLAGVCCGVSALIFNFVLLNVGIPEKLTTLVAIAGAVAVYFAVLVFGKGICRDDVLMMPKGEKICGVMDKYNLLEK